MPGDLFMSIMQCNPLILVQSYVRKLICDQRVRHSIIVLFFSSKEQNESNKNKNLSTNYSLENSFHHGTFLLSPFDNLWGGWQSFVLVHYHIDTATYCVVRGASVLGSVILNFVCNSNMHTEADLPLIDWTIHMLFPFAAYIINTISLCLDWKLSYKFSKFIRLWHVTSYKEFIQWWCTQGNWGKFPSWDWQAV